VELGGVAVCCVSVCVLQHVAACSTGVVRLFLLWRTCFLMCALEYVCVRVGGGCMGVCVCVCGVCVILLWRTCF